MNNALALVLFIAAMVGSVCAAAYLCLLPPRLFMRGGTWLTEEEFRAAAPTKAWCRRVPVVGPIVAFVTYVALFIGVQATCPNKVVMVAGMVPLFFLWIYVPVGVVELFAGVSVLVTVGKARGREPRYLAGPGAARAGAFRLGVTAAVFGAVLVGAYW